MTLQKKPIFVLNEEESNLHEGRSAAKDGPNLSPILDSDFLGMLPLFIPFFLRVTS